MRRERATLIIQKSVKCWLQHRKYLQIRRSAVLIQTYGRAILARRKYTNMKKERAVSRTTYSVSLAVIGAFHIFF
jgi:myosin-5